MNIIIEIRNARGQFMEFLRKHNFDWAWKAMMEGNISKMYYVHSTPSSAGYIASYIRFGEKDPDLWKGVHATAEEFIQYYEGKTETLKTMDTRYMPSTAGPEDYGRCSITVTQDPDSGKVTHLHTKFLPTMNYYNIAVIKKSTHPLYNNENKKDNILIPLKQVLATSEKDAEVQVYRELTDDNIDDVSILIEPIF